MIPYWMFLKTDCPFLKAPVLLFKSPLYFKILIDDCCVFLPVLRCLLNQSWSDLLFGMAAMPFLCRRVWFSPKLPHHRNVSLAVYLPIFYFLFDQKTYIATPLLCHSPQCYHCLLYRF